MKQLIPIDLTAVVDEVKAEGKGRRVLWQDSESQPKVILTPTSTPLFLKRAPD